ncbi:MAG TPA: linear amide C-N hydrolase [Candidatus Krumholzibacteria bacterium]|nr:linear amide C-N hydrolase [Candidatus Krumholzibacteria bacterium]
MNRRALLMAALALALIAQQPRACTTFCFNGDGNLVFGKNYDWGIGMGLVVVNKRLVMKRAFVDEGAFVWTSRYGSVTFNQYGREFPCGGMNEAGLVVELMWLDDTRYPATDERGALPTLQWIQYQLDRSASVADVVASDQTVRISGASARIHFLVADASGDVAAVEFLDGRMVVHRGDDLPYPALTNDTYEKSAAYARAYDTAPREASRSSLDRFATAAHAVEAGPPAGTEPVDAAFDLLDRVAQGDHTQWSIVYDVAIRRVYFRTRSNPMVRWIDARTLNFDCSTPVRILDVNAPESGDVTGELRDYEYTINRATLGAAYAGTDFLRGVSARELDELAHFPDGTRCSH